MLPSLVGSPGRRECRHLFSSLCSPAQSNALPSPPRPPLFACGCPSAYSAEVARTEALNARAEEAEMFKAKVEEFAASLDQEVCVRGLVSEATAEYDSTFIVVFGTLHYTKIPRHPTTHNCHRVSIKIRELPMVQRQQHCAGATQLPLSHRKLRLYLV